MKSLIASACIFLASTTFAQQDMFWNNYSNFNPAMSGFQYQQHGALSYSDYFNNESGRPSSIIGNYNLRLANKHGLGINYTGVYNNINYASYSVNYNHQFDLKKAGYLSTGIGAGLYRISENPTFHQSNNTTPLSNEYLLLNLGIAYKWKGLTTGISVMNRRLTEANDEILRLASANAFVEYEFALGEQFQLTPRIIYGATDNSYQGGITTDLTLAFRKKFSIGATYNIVDNRIGIHTAWDINERFRIAYMFNTQVSAPNRGAIITPRHQFTLGYILK